MFAGVQWWGRPSASAARRRMGVVQPCFEQCLFIRHFDTLAVQSTVCSPLSQPRCGKRAQLAVLTTFLCTALAACYFHSFAWQCLEPSFGSHTQCGRHPLAGSPYWTQAQALHVTIALILRRVVPSRACLSGCFHAAQLCGGASSSAPALFLPRAVPLGCFW